MATIRVEVHLENRPEVRREALQEYRRYEQYSFSLDDAPGGARLTATFEFPESVAQGIVESATNEHGQIRGRSALCRLARVARDELGRARARKERAARKVPKTPEQIARGNDETILNENLRAWGKRLNPQGDWTVAAGKVGQRSIHAYRTLQMARSRLTAFDRWDGFEPGKADAILDAAAEANRKAQRILGAISNELGGEP